MYKLAIFNSVSVKFPFLFFALYSMENAFHININAFAICSSEGPPSLCFAFCSYLWHLLSHRILKYFTLFLEIFLLVFCAAVLSLDFPFYPE